MNFAVKVTLHVNWNSLFSLSVEWCSNFPSHCWISPSLPQSGFFLFIQISLLLISWYTLSISARHGSSVCAFTQSWSCGFVFPKTFCPFLQPVHIPIVNQHSSLHLSLSFLLLFYHHWSLLSNVYWLLLPIEFTSAFH